MKSQLVSTLQHHYFVRSLRSLQPAIHPPRPSPSNPPIHQPTHPHIYVYIYFYPSIHAPILASSFILVPTFRTGVAIGDPQLRREPSHSFGSVTFTWYSLIHICFMEANNLLYAACCASFVSHFIVESTFDDEEHGTFQLYGPLHDTSAYGCNNESNILAFISIMCRVSLI
jgi:hypothetical protein